MFATTSVVAVDLAALGARSAIELVTAVESAAVDSAADTTTQSVQVSLLLVSQIAVSVPASSTVEDTRAALADELCAGVADCTVTVASARRARQLHARLLTSTGFTVTLPVNGSSSAAVAAPTVDATALATALGVATVDAAVSSSNVEAVVTVVSEGAADSGSAAATQLTTQGAMPSALASSLGISANALALIEAPTTVTPPLPPPPPSPPSSSGGGAAALRSPALPARSPSPPSAPPPVVHPAVHVDHPENNGLLWVAVAALISVGLPVVVACGAIQARRHVNLEAAMRTLRVQVKPTSGSLLTLGPHSDAAEPPPGGLPAGGGAGTGYEKKGTARGRAAYNAMGTELALATGKVERGDQFNSGQLLSSAI